MNIISKWMTISLLAMVSYTATAQSEAGKMCAVAKQQFFTAQHKTTVASVSEDDYDIKYVMLDLNMTNTSTTLNGSVKTVAKVVAGSMSQYVFELNDLLNIDSVKINGIPYTVTTNGYIRTVTLSAALPSGSSFTAQVYYHGNPVSGTLGAVEGINNLTSPTWGAQVTYTMSQPYEASQWWPCKQSLKDRIDSADIWLTVPTGLKAGSNGLLQAITPIGITANTYKWKEKNQIDYYLISAAVGPYVDYIYYVHFPSIPDSLLVQNYIYDNPGTLPAVKSIVDSTGIMIQYFSTLFGLYPFMNEKYGHCMGPLSGGMEHQTMTTLGFFEVTLVAHELAHQWFGDHVTCATWKDIWLNEGFASYAEYLYINNFRGAAAGTQYIRNFQNSVISPNQLTGTVYVDDTTSEARIFSSRLSYDKAAAIIHTLRFVAPTDAMFFQMLQTYQQTYASVGTATTDQFKSVAQTVYNQNLDTFFNQWIYGEGYPIYNTKWNQIGNDVYVQLTQTTAVPTSIPLFSTPLELKLKSLAGDTVVKVYNNQAVQDYHFTWNRPMNNVQIDPNNWIIDADNGAVKDPTLDIATVNTTAITAYPNPTYSNWTISHIPAKTTLTLTDIWGRVLWSTTTTDNTESVPAASLPAGIYMLQATNADGVTTFRLIKQ